MIEQKEVFQTPEFFLACYLKAKEVKFIGLEKIQGSKYNFLFERDEKLQEVMNAWYTSETDFDRDLLQACTDLKFTLKTIKKEEGIING